jgi:CRISPR-associated exonuclease Cas4
MKKSISASLVNMFHVCKRELWLHARHINMEQTSDLVYEGKLIGEESYPQRTKNFREVDLGIAKIDFYDYKNKVVHETKKSDKLEHAHIAQVKYYLYLLENAGVDSPTAILEYPTSRKIHKVEALTSQDKSEIESWLSEIEQILEQETCPVLVKKRYCKTCSYFDLCYVDTFDED